MDGDGRRREPSTREAPRKPAAIVSGQTLPRHSRYGATQKGYRHGWKCGARIQAPSHCTSQACGGIRPVAFVHAAKSGWRKKRRRSQPSVAPVFGGGLVAVWWLQACATPPVLETKTDGLPSDTHSSTLSNDDMPPFAKIRPALVARHRSEHVMENIHGPQRPRRAISSAPADVAAAQTRRDVSRAKGRCAAGGPVAACSRSSRRLRYGRSKRECGE
jgi:hypothetical protein